MLIAWAPLNQEQAPTSVEEAEHLESLTGLAVKTSLARLVIALAAWFVGAAWWMSRSLGASRWLGGVLEVVGFFGTLTAIGMTWRAFSGRRAIRADLSRQSVGVPIETDPPSRQGTSNRSCPPIAATAEAARESAGGATRSSRPSPPVLRSPKSGPSWWSSRATLRSTLPPSR
jgi:hypothetical protein